MNAAKGVVRSVKNYTKGYSDIQIKVRCERFVVVELDSEANTPLLLLAALNREATSNDPAPASQSQMAAIARGTHNHRDFIEIMEMIDKRLNDSGKNWRHVYKVCIHTPLTLSNGSGRDRDETRIAIHWSCSTSCWLPVQKTLSNMPKKTSMYQDLKEFMYIDEDGRDHGANVRQLSKDITAHLSDDARLREERNGRAQNHRFSGSDDDDGDRDRRRGNGNGYGNEDDELRRALEESKRTAEARSAEEPRKTRHLKKALELNERETKKEPEIIDFFSPVQTAQPNMFETNANPFGGFGQMDPYALQMQQQQQMQQQLLLQQQQQQQEQARQLALQEAQRQQQLLALQQQQQQQALMSGFAAYDAQAATKAVAADPLFDVARNSSQIDPFANLAVSRGSVSAIGISSVRSNSIAGPSNPFGNTSTSTPFGTQPAQTQANNLFGNVNAASNNNSAFNSAPSGGVAKNPFGGPAAQSSPFGTTQQQPQSHFGNLGMPQSRISSSKDFGDLSPFPKNNSGPIGAMGQQQQQPSPFGTFGGAQQQQPSPFGAIPQQQPSPFGTQGGFGASNQPFGSQGANAFGGSLPNNHLELSSSNSSHLQNAFGQQPFGGQQQQQFPMPGQQQQQYNAFGQQQQQPSFF
ncbi:hypothetical protein BCR33DRAFT_781059 [Rhizoclosmatium globosum]|uniref:ENTH domain-containing protein n=1 Tax=Rhizoclosmatium globosum TaxID=329046 RepID=A0A1Y2CTD6_9FUNG|nr:hypothetical protein BCR33DRAFT_781059 [Rhizoclosmatium globosum]|eukprot:ORY50299.1 hypothetical protein BCR33DRAFT_781059 [Rhizoclosmatium globosum]